MTGTHTGVSSRAEATIRSSHVAGRRALTVICPTPSEQASNERRRQRPSAPVNQHFSPRRSRKRTCAAWNVVGSGERAGLSIGLPDRLYWHVVLKRHLQRMTQTKALAFLVRTCVLDITERPTDVPEAAFTVGGQESETEESRSAGWVPHAVHGPQHDCRRACVALGGKHPRPESRRGPPLPCVRRSPRCAGARGRGVAERSPAALLRRGRRRGPTEGR
jgi:hypothetical protein